MVSTEIDLPLGDLTTPEEWGTQAFVYAPTEKEFYITKEKHKALEAFAPRKFEAKVSVKDGKEVIITLPTEFARAYFWEKDAKIVKIVNGNTVALAIFSNPKLDAKVQV